MPPTSRWPQPRRSNVNAEMGKLLDLENMFAANAQVILVFKDLMDTL